MTGKRWIGWIAVITFVLAIGWPARAEGSVADLVGVWKVKVTPNEETARAGKLEFNDNLVIEEDSQFTAEAFGPMGFPPAPVTADETTGSFSCTTENESQGSIVWTGTRDGLAITGTMVWTKPDGSVARYSFTGTQKKA